MNQPRIFKRRQRRPRITIETLEARIAPAVFNPLAATVDGAAGSLRDAILAANANGENDIFNLGEGTYTLNLADIAGQENASATGDLDLTEQTFTFTFNGAGVGLTIIDQAAVDRVFQIFSNVNVSFNNLTIRGGDAVDDGTAGALPDLGNGNGGGILSAGNVTLTGASVIDNSAAGADVGEGGGGIFNSGGMLTLTNTTISGNIALVGLGNGGGIFNSGGTVNIAGGTITSNHAARAGGGIEHNLGNLTMSNVTLGGATPAAGNTTGINGGGLHISGAGTVTINGGTVSNNLAEQEGGGLWNSSTGALIVQASATISSNIANGDGTEQGGGGIFSDGGNTLIIGATITNNSATATAVGNGGGGIFNDGQMTITNAIISNNTATSGTANGGGILNSNGGNLTIIGSTISSNQAARAGGGIENNLGTLTMTDVTLGGGAPAAGNTTGINGGGLHISGAGSVTINGGTVSNNVAGQEGGGLWNSSTGVLLVQTSLVGGTTISSNIANGDGTEQGGGGIFSDGGNTTVIGATISNNGASASAVGNGGGGIFNDGPMTITNTFIANNFATNGMANGGGILNSNGGNLTIIGSTISSNQAARAGGGIENNLGTLTMTDVTLGGGAPAAGNTTGINGGGLHISGAGSVTINGGTVSNNVAGQEGGGLWNSSTGVLLVQTSLVGGTTISSNIANGDGTEQGGGGIFSDGGNTTVIGATISNNGASASAVGNGGGGIFNDGPMTITNTFIANNFATNGMANGGGILNSNGGNLTVTGGSTVINNQAARAGGGIENNGGMVTLTDVGLNLNSAGVNGGGLHTSGAGVVTINRGFVQENVATNEGGGLWNSSSGILNVNATIMDGNDALTGAGIFGDGTGGAITVIASSISNNVAMNLGGGFSIEGGTLTIVNSTVSGNESTTTGGGGIFVGGGTVDVFNSTIAENNAVNVGAGGVEQGGGVISLFSTIVANNTRNGQIPIDVASSSGTINAANSLIENVAVGTVNGTNTANIFNDDPLLGPLEDNGGPTPGHALQIGSRAINAGSNVRNESFDQRGDGFPRVFGSRADIGAFEFTPPPIVAVGAGAGAPPRVTIFSAADGSSVQSFLAFGQNFRKGVTVATGDINGDGLPEVIVGRATGDSMVKVFDALTGENIDAFRGFAAAYRGGVHLATGDIDNDGSDDILVGKASGVAAIKVFSGETGGVLEKINPFPTAFRGGVTVASGDVNDDGFDDIIAGRAKDSKAQVRIFDGQTGDQLSSFFAFDPQFRGGVFVAAGDVTGDGVAEIIAGNGKGELPILHVLDPLTGDLLAGPGRDFLAFPQDFLGGVRVAAGDLNGDGIADIITAPGKGLEPVVSVFNGTNGNVINMFLLTTSKGIFVG